ncbi:hypothetical protein GMDG_00718 [Pseudogymnoascus destructans 20631-21]|uniref:MIP18 family-like domain-containing protein n=1 Tax=Pseudogymnoascus destructans (strain ATCC MYA-4855 / 20631-21) TaxID=658429 RepID=L8G9R0_PSED2|nr:hypothetical protein GMDG_00718 [Pseudogymnoascus destructans 20631-21]
MAIENANPTIINVDELPTRRGKPKSLTKEDHSILSLLTPTPNPALQIYLDGEEPLSDAEDELTEEPIDEQEIYGSSITPSPPSPIRLTLYIHGLIDEPQLTPPRTSSPPSPTPNTPSPSAPSPSSTLPTSSSPPPPHPTELVTVTVLITPTITHCSLATVIGLGVRVRLEQALPPRFRVDVRIKPGTHSQDEQVNKQLADKERVAAALENATLLKVLMTMLETCA